MVGFAASPSSSLAGAAGVQRRVAGPWAPERSGWTGLALGELVGVRASLTFTLRGGTLYSFGFQDPDAEALPLKLKTDDAVPLVAMNGAVI